MKTKETKKLSPEEKPFRQAPYATQFANLVMGDGGVHGPGRIRVFVFEEGAYPAPGFWSPKTRQLGVEKRKGYSYDEVELFKGLLLHETGHIRDTDPGAWEIGVKEGLKTLVNILEDPRVEDRQAKRYPGFRSCTNALRNYVYQSVMKGLQSGKFSPYSALLGVCSEIPLRSRLYNRELYKGALTADGAMTEAEAEEAINEFIKACKDSLASKDAFGVVDVARRIKKYFPDDKDKDKGEGDGDGEGEGEEEEGSGSGGSSGTPGTKKGKKGGKLSKEAEKSAAEDKKAAEEIVEKGTERRMNEGEDDVNTPNNMDPLPQYNRPAEALKRGEWKSLLRRANRNLEIPAWKNMEKILVAHAPAPETSKSGRIDGREYFRIKSSQSKSRDYYEIDEEIPLKEVRIALVMDGSGSMSGKPIDESCRVVYTLGRLASIDRRIKVQAVLCNSGRCESLPVLQYDRPMDQDAIDVLRTYSPDGNGEGLLTSEPYIVNPRPDMALFLTDACVTEEDLQWLREMRLKVPVRAAYVGHHTPIEALEGAFGQYYICKSNAEDLGIHLVRFLTEMVK